MLSALSDIELRILFNSNCTILTANYLRKPNKAFEKLLNLKMFLCNSPTIRKLNRRNNMFLTFHQQKDQMGNWEWQAFTFSSLHLIIFLAYKLKVGPTKKLKIKLIIYDEYTPNANMVDPSAGPGLVARKQG